MKGGKTLQVFQPKIIWFDKQTRVILIMENNADVDRIWVTERAEFSEYSEGIMTLEEFPNFIEYYSIPYIDFFQKFAP